MSVNSELVLKLAWFSVVDLKKKQKTRIAYWQNKILCIERWFVFGICIRQRFLALNPEI